MANEIVTLIANIALALSFIVALIFGIAQVRAAARDRRERLAMETLRNFQTREFAELIHYVTSHTMPTSQKEMEALPHDQQIIFIQLAQQMESLGILVQSGLIDTDLVDRTLGSFVTVAWKKYKVMFMSMRDNDPFLGEYFQWLAERIDKQMTNNPREPVYKT